MPRRKRHQMTESFERYAIAVMNEFRYRFLETRLFQHAPHRSKSFSNTLEWDGSISGRSAVWLAHLPWAQGVGGSNPLAPIEIERVSPVIGPGFFVGCG